MNDTMTKRDHIAAMMMASIGRGLLEADSFIPDHDRTESELAYKIRRKSHDCCREPKHWAAIWAYQVADALIDVGAGNIR